MFLCRYKFIIYMSYMYEIEISASGIVTIRRRTVDLMLSLSLFNLGSLAEAVSAHAGSAWRAPDLRGSLGSHCQTGGTL